MATRSRVPAQRLVILELVHRRLSALARHAQQAVGVDIAAEFSGQTQLAQRLQAADVSQDGFRAGFARRLAQPGQRGDRTAFVHFEQAIQARQLRRAQGCRQGNPPLGAGLHFRTGFHRADRRQHDAAPAHFGDKACANAKTLGADCMAMGGSQCDRARCSCRFSAQPEIPRRGNRMLAASLVALRGSSAPSPKATP